MLSETLSKTILFAGHYGSGKTNMALALAVELKKAGREVTVIDLDIINPYFRLADGSERLAANPNLGRETTAETITTALPFTKALSEETGLPIVLTAVRKDLAEAVAPEISGEILEIEILEKPGWEIY